MSTAITDSDIKFLMVALTCLKQPLELDTKMASEKLGITPKSVGNKWWDVRRKLFGKDATAAASGSKRKRGAVAKKDEESEGEGEASPTKKGGGKARTPAAAKKAASARKGKAVEVPMAEEDDVEDYDEEEDGDGEEDYE